MTTSTDIVKSDDIRNALIEMAEAQSVTSEDVQRDIVQRILDAETIDEAAQSFEALSAEDVEGRRLTVHGIAWLKSTYKEGPPVYALIDCTPANTRKRVKVSMGGRSAMAFLLWCQEHRAMPFDVVFTRSEPSGENGYRYWKVNLPAGASK
jgi:predicted transcriptional regulator